MKHTITFIAFVVCSLTALSQIIVDNANLFTANDKSEIKSRLINLEEKTSVETLIYTTKDLEGKTPIEYGKKLSLKYSVGKKGINNGIIILVSKNDRKVQILVGYGLEWILSDKETKIIIDQMIPYFKKSKYYKAINIAIDQINEKISTFNWQIHNTYEIAEKYNGKVYMADYINFSGNTNYKYIYNSEPQFSNDYFINIEIDNIRFNLYYSKYMNELISTILSGNKISIFFVLKDYDNKELELLGIK